LLLEQVLAVQVQDSYQRAIERVPEQSGQEEQTLEQVAQ
jgi:hypothetical protein